MTSLDILKSFHDLPDETVEDIKDIETRLFTLLLVKRLTEVIVNSHKDKFIYMDTDSTIVEE